MRVLEKAEEDEGFMAMAQLANLKAKKEALAPERDLAIKAK